MGNGMLSYLPSFCNIFPARPTPARCEPVARGLRCRCHPLLEAMAGRTRGVVTPVCLRRSRHPVGLMRLGLSAPRRPLTHTDAPTLRVPACPWDPSVGSPPQSSGLHTPLSTTLLSHAASIGQWHRRLGKEPPGIDGRCAGVPWFEEKCPRGLRRSAPVV